MEIGRGKSALRGFDFWGELHYTWGAMEEKSPRNWVQFEAVAKTTEKSGGKNNSVIY